MTVTVLHISDTQFADYHRFGVGDDSLAAGLIRALQELPQEIPTIDVVVFSGDAAEQGKPSEFAMAADFLRQMLSALDLPPERLVIVPGNHDVNWHACRAYVEGELAAERPPVPPFGPRWGPYLSFLTEVYNSDNSPPLDEIRSFPDLNLTIAALNSTVDETHENHWGACGAEQMRRHADEISKASGHRIAVVHHHLRQTAVVASEHLRDAQDFELIVAPRVDLVLHGHTHNGKRDYMPNGTLVLSTGSASLEGEQRGPEVPNQFQIVVLGERDVERWAFRYAPEHKAWRLDTDVGDNALPRPRGDSPQDGHDPAGRQCPTRTRAAHDRRCCRRLAFPTRRSRGDLGHLSSRLLG